jgi:hypothetical protein
LGAMRCVMGVPPFRGILRRVQQRHSCRDDDVGLMGTSRAQSRLKAPTSPADPPPLSTGQEAARGGDTGMKLFPDRHGFDWSAGEEGYRPFEVSEVRTQ